MGFFDFLHDKTSKTNLEIQHPGLGRLIYEDDGWWMGQVVLDGLEIEITIDGDENGIDAGLDEICIKVLNHFPEFHEKAQEKLKQTVLDYKILISLKFTPYGIFNIWSEVNNERFTIGFNDNHEPYKLWRVEFENGKAIGCGYDD
jgi:hypothetical protein